LGLKLAHNKNAAGLRALRMERCESVTLPMLQHIGVPCLPRVKRGDYVLAGQVVGDTQAPLAAPVHASVSGAVEKLVSVRLPQGGETQAVVIRSDGEMNRIETGPPQVNSLEDFLGAVRASGLVGLGGAGFPAHAKLRSAAGKADVLLVNAAACEPYMAADLRELLDNGENVADGIRHVCHWLSIREAVVGIESYHKEAIAHMGGLCEPWMRIGTLPGRYPTGAEKLLAHRLTGRIVPMGRLPLDAGVLVMNVSSLGFLGRYMRGGRPLTSRTITVDGGAASKPANLRIPIGLSLRELCAFCEIEKPPAKIILGGPMMGLAAPDLDTPLDKRTGGVLLLDEKQAARKAQTACIRCGACLFACPMALQPFKIEKAAAARDAAALEALYAGHCMECGCCAYACPARRELVQAIRVGKAVLSNG